MMLRARVCCACVCGVRSRLLIGCGLARAETRCTLLYIVAVFGRAHARARVVGLWLCVWVGVGATRKG